MRHKTTVNNFDQVTHPTYANPPKDYRIVQESSMIGEYPDSRDIPGSSFLWIGENHHLNREEVQELVGYLTRWLKTGQLC